MWNAHVKLACCVWEGMLLLGFICRSFAQKAAFLYYSLPPCNMRGSIASGLIQPLLACCAIAHDGRRQMCQTCNRIIDTTPVRRQINRRVVPLFAADAGGGKRRFHVRTDNKSKILCLARDSASCKCAL